MPEGDSVYRLAKRLRFMTGREVTHTSIRVPRYATTDFTGMTCTRVWPIGKHLFMQFETAGHVPQVLQTHLKMEGNWASYPAGSRRDPGHSARVVLRLKTAGKDDEVEVVGHWLGLVEVWPITDFDRHAGHLGPDLLDPDFDQAEAVRRIMATPELEIGRALLDQTNLAGIGNEYRAEACFLAGIHPRAKVKDVDVDKVVKIARRLMWANKDQTRRVSTGVHRGGESAYVFGRNHKPCRRCGTLIKNGFLGGENDLERVIWWCPHCQPAPAADPS